MVSKISITSMKDFHLSFYLTIFLKRIEREELVKKFNMYCFALLQGQMPIRRRRRNTPVTVVKRELSRIF